MSYPSRHSCPYWPVQPRTVSQSVVPWKYAGADSEKTMSRPDARQRLGHLRVRGPVRLLLVVWPDTAGTLQPSSLR